MFWWRMWRHTISSLPPPPLLLVDRSASPSLNAPAPNLTSSEETALNCCCSCACGAMDCCCWCRVCGWCGQWKGANCWWGGTEEEAADSIICGGDKWHRSKWQIETELQKTEIKFHCARYVCDISHLSCNRKTLFQFLKDQSQNLGSIWYFEHIFSTVHIISFSGLP